MVRDRTHNVDIESNAPTVAPSRTEMVIYPGELLWDIGARFMRRTMSSDFQFASELGNCVLVRDGCFRCPEEPVSRIGLIQVGGGASERGRNSVSELEQDPSTLRCRSHLRLDRVNARLNSDMARLGRLRDRHAHCRHALLQADRECTQTACGRVTGQLQFPHRA